MILKIPTLSVEETLFFWCDEDGFPIAWIMTVNNTIAYANYDDALKAVYDYAEANNYNGVELP
jgi:hypothetical protein